MMSGKWMIVPLLILAVMHVGWGQTVWESRISDGNDDVEQDASGGGMYTNSSDLEIFSDGGTQVIGLRFNAVDVPQGAAIVDAYLEFVCDETKSGTLPVNVIIDGHADAYPAEFSSSNHDVSGRPRTAAKAAWTPEDWTSAGQVSQTSNIGPVVEEIVGLKGWVPGNSLVLILNDNEANPSTGIRCAEAYEGSSSSAALLHLVWEEATKATNPSPSTDETDVLRDIDLSWAPALNVNTLYLGTTYEAVEAATATSHAGASVFPNLMDGTFDPGRLEFGTTYFWRVDGTSPATGTVKGKIWNFTVEPLSYRVPAPDISATASGQANPDSTPSKTIDGSGLMDGLHSNTDSDMWLSSTGAAADTFIQYAFNRPQLLQKMMVWNYNASSESFVGWGIKDVTVEYSQDGETWTTLEQITALSQAAGVSDYEAADVFEFSPPVVASGVRMTPQSNHGGLLQQYGLSEVQFYAYPTYAANLQPADGTTIDLGNAPAFTWSPGRNVDHHVVLQSTDPLALVEVASGPDAQYDVLSSNPFLGETYYWRVDEVNENEDATVWAGDVQSFSVLPYRVVDDFESYGNVSPNRPFQTWLDSYGFSPDDFFPAGYSGNGSGAGVGHDIWNVSSPHFQGSIMGTDQTMPGSGKSLPFYFTGNSETTRTFVEAQDWTRAGVTTLSLWFYGDLGNTASQMYVKINGLKVPYNGSASDLQVAGWQVWNIDLASLNDNLQSVTSLTFGVEGASASGMLLIDDIALQQTPLEALTEWRVSASADDAEEHVLNGGVMDLTSSDLELGYEGAMVPEALQTTGCRWTDIAIPKGATITEAWVQFSADAVGETFHIGDVSLVITGELTANSVSFTTDLMDVSSRPVTTTSVVWDIPEWTTVHGQGPEERTPDISSVIQEIVNQNAWSGTVVLMFSDNPAKPSQATREAEAYDGAPSEAPLLHIAFE